MKTPRERAEEFSKEWDDVTLQQSLLSLRDEALVGLLNRAFPERIKQMLAPFTTVDINNTAFFSLSGNGQAMIILRGHLSIYLSLEQKDQTEFNRLHKWSNAAANIFFFNQMVVKKLLECGNAVLVSKMIDAYCHPIMGDALLCINGMRKLVEDFFTRVTDAQLNKLAMMCNHITLQYVITYLSELGKDDWSEEFDKIFDHVCEMMIAKGKNPGVTVSFLNLDVDLIVRFIDLGPSKENKVVFWSVDSTTKSIFLKYVPPAIQAQYVNGNSKKFAQLLAQISQVDTFVSDEALSELVQSETLETDLNNIAALCSGLHTRLTCDGKVFDQFSLDELRELIQLGFLQALLTVLPEDCLTFNPYQIHDLYKLFNRNRAVFDALHLSDFLQCHDESGDPVQAYVDSQLVATPVKPGDDTYYKMIADHVVDQLTDGRQAKLLRLLQSDYQDMFKNFESQNHYFPKLSSTQDCYNDFFSRLIEHLYLTQGNTSYTKKELDACSGLFRHKGADKDKYQSPKDIMRSLVFRASSGRNSFGFFPSSRSMALLQQIMCGANSPDLFALRALAIESAKSAYPKKEDRERFFGDLFESRVECQPVRTVTSKAICGAS